MTNRDSPGSVAVLNVGAGDTKLTFDKGNPAERIRAARIVKDMIRRGYALLVETDDGNGGKVFVRAHDFDENTCEYIIADFDPVIAAEADSKEERHERQQEEPTPTQAPRGATKARSGKSKKLDAARSRAISVAPSAGG